MAADSTNSGRHTPCVEVRDEASGETLILDAGSGIVQLGQQLVDEPRALAILLSHHHRGHVEGLPTFAPFHQPGWTPAIVSPDLPGTDAAWLERLFAPVRLDTLPSPPRLRQVRPGSFELGRFRVEALALTHPGGCLAYRVQGADASGDLVYAPDHEFGNLETDIDLAGFALNCGALVIDAHYTPDEIPAARRPGP